MAGSVADHPGLGGNPRAASAALRQFSGVPTFLPTRGGLAVSKQTGKGSRHHRRASAIERKATQHHDFVGQADVERAEAEFRKHDRLQAEENHEVVREMAAEIRSEEHTSELQS